MPDAESDSQPDEEEIQTHTVSIRLPVELVNRADIVAAVNGVSRRSVVEESIQNALETREQDPKYQSLYRAACNRGDISLDTLIAALGEEPFETQPDNMDVDVDEERIRQLVDNGNIGDHVLNETGEN